MIQTVNDALRRITAGDFNQRLASFLLSQHATLCATTARSPAELFMNRRMKSRLDCLHLNLSSERQRKIDDNAPSVKPRLLDNNQSVLVKNFFSGQKWTQEQSTGPASYKAKTSDGKVVHRHIGHIIKYDIRNADPTEAGLTESPFREHEVSSDTNEQTPLLKKYRYCSHVLQGTVDHLNVYEIISSKRMVVLCIEYDRHFTCPSSRLRLS
ncbi:hypothetical protein M513_06441 [Trichuris suis]|uniref:Uncharacterized protein n=1 Tax=Trichuris suis TaxID=68888 RepID=A0A085M5U8_9BILA|nr:hypothetical protein M513_06441 [Trichuris suis]